jgi:hypothetical protein
MKRELFQDLMKVHKTLTGVKAVTWKQGQIGVNLWSLLGNVMLQHATKAEIAEMVEAGILSSREAKQRPSAVAQPRKVKSVRVPAGTKLPPDAFVCVLGPYGTEVAAKSDVEQFKHPQVFLYRSAIFPNPTNFRVNASVLEAVVVKNAGSNLLYPFGIRLTIKVTGAVDRVQSWITEFKNRTRMLTML